jgi:hypothetical protein
MADIPIQDRLRAERFLRDGKYIAAKLTITGVIDDFPMQHGKGTKLAYGLQFKETRLIFGMNATNLAALCWEIGDGRPEAWIGKRIQFVVRLIENKKLKTWEPGLRIWPRNQLQNVRIREQMGVEITDEWYAKNMPQETKVEQ